LRKIIGERVRRVTYIELKALLNYIMKIKPPEFDLAQLGIDPQDMETVRKFWQEYCNDLKYSECKQIVRRLIPYARIEEYDPAQERYFIITQFESYFREKYGTGKVYELYKKIHDEEHEDYSRILRIRNGKIQMHRRRKRESNAIPPTANCSNIEEFIKQMQYVGFSYAKSLAELEDYRARIGIVTPTRDAKILLCLHSRRDQPPSNPPNNNTNKGRSSVME
jgi:hypothetical protein